MIDYSKNIIQDDATIREALGALNELSQQSNLSLFVVNAERQLIATLTDGDIRRGLLSGKSLDDSVKEVMFSDFRYLRENDEYYKSIGPIRKSKIEHVPLVDTENRILDIINLNDTVSLLPIDAVIMAGGEGKRLSPLTLETPKPLLEIGGKPILEYSLDLLRKYGITKINLSLNYLADQIEDYFGTGAEKGLELTYIKEENAMGTMGAVSLVKEYFNDYVLVMNSDLLTTIDLEAFFLSLLENDADMVVASVPYNVRVPYATLNLKDGQVESLQEKPTLTFYSNAGIYLMKKHVLDLVPDDQKFDATDLMDKVIEEKMKLVSFPILGYWLDIGKPEDYSKAQEDIKNLKLS